MKAEQNMQEFVKEVEKRRIPLHRVLIAQHGNHVHMWRQQVWHLAQWLPI